MNLRIKTLLMISLILISSLLSGCSLLRGIIPSLPNKEASPVHNLTKDTYYVPGDYSTIQAAVDVANPGDTIIVRDGTYTENINVNKDHLIIKSENGAEETIVQAADPKFDVIGVRADYVSISGFTIIGANGESVAGIKLTYANYCNLYENRVLNNYDIGIFLYYSSNNSIKDNNVSSNGEGIFLDSSSHNMVSRNNIHNNDARAIYLHSSLNNVIDNNVSLNNESGVELYHSQDNILRNNTLKNKLGVTLVDSQNNIVFLNNFVNTVYNYVLIDSTNLWSSSEKITYTYNGKTYTNYLGNYWSDYSVSDANADGIGDTPYSINSDKDNYPLMKPFENYVIGEAPPVYPGYAIIVAGQAGWREKWLINRSTNCAYRVLCGLGFTDDDIFYLNNEAQDADDDGHNDVDGDPTRDNLKEAITEWATQRVGPSAPLILCMVGHGMEVGSFDLNELDQVLGFELEEWFGVLPKENEILIVIDACYSGSFITHPVNSISSKNRVIVTSCRADQEVFPYFNAFAKLFWEYLYLQQGYDVKEAFIRASQWPEWGEPQLDDPSEIAATMIIGRPSGPIIDLERLRWTTLCSPAELRVYDSEGRITGLVSGNIKEEIPDSIYIEESKTVIIWPAIDTYCDEVVGTDAGTYGLTVITSEDEETSVFTATDIPTSKNEIHQYTIDWDILSQGGEGVTVQIDSDGDGEFEWTCTSDSEFTSEDIFNPTYVFTDPKRGTKLGIKIDNKTFQFIASDGYDTGIVVADCMLTWRDRIFISHREGKCFKLSANVRTKNDFCWASLRDYENWKWYFLFDLPGVEEKGFVDFKAPGDTVAPVISDISATLVDGAITLNFSLSENMTATVVLEDAGGTPVIVVPDEDYLAGFNTVNLAAEDTETGMPLIPGGYTVWIIAIDAAGNFVTESRSVTIK